MTGSTHTTQCLRQAYSSCLVLPSVAPVQKLILLKMCLYTIQLWLRPIEVTLWKLTRLLQFGRKY